MKSELICKLCGASLGRMHGNEQQWELLKHYKHSHISEYEHLVALRKDYLEHKETYGLSSVIDLAIN